MLQRDDWAIEYEGMLERRGPDRIANALAAVADQHNAETLVLACFEGDPADCHRGVFARWWQDATDETVLDLTEICR